MRLLVVGGSGLVASLVLPHLAREHQIRVFDLQAPLVADPAWEIVIGTLEDFAAVREAAAGCQAMVFMAMNRKQPWGELPAVTSAYDVNVKGLHLAHWAAHLAGVRRVVVTSSLSVYTPRPEGVRYPTEDEAPDGDDFYGLTKRLGEQVSESAARRLGQAVVSLRLCFPWPDDAPAPSGADDQVGTESAAFRAATYTRARDVASAILCALRYEHRGWQAFAISGDPGQRVVPTRKAREVLGWAPAAEEGRT